jgi:predicted MFS family arabinose efflux permease
MLGTAASTTLGAAVAARLLGGVAHAVFTSCSFAMAVSVVPPAWRGRAVAIIGAGNAIALALGVPAATALGAQLGWRVPFQVAAAALLGILVAIVVLHRPSAAAAAPEASSARSLLAAAKDPALVRVAVVIVLVMSAHFLTYTYVAPILIGAGVPEASVGFVLIGYGVAGAAGLLVAGRIADRRPRGMLIVTIAVTAAALALLWLLRGSAPGVVAATGVWGSAFGAAPVLWQLIAVRAAPAAASVGPAVVNSAFNVGISLGALGGGSLLAIVPPSALALPSVALLVVALVLAIRRRWLPADARAIR